MIKAIPKNTWRIWVNNYFYKGKTAGIYLLMIMFVISAIELSINRLSLNTYIPLLIMTIFSYGVFTDLVAHLWWDGYNTNISFKKFVTLVFKGRTHDIYGLTVYLILCFYLLWYINKVPIIALILMDLMVMALIIKTKFYH